MENTTIKTIAELKITDAVKLAAYNNKVGANLDQIDALIKQGEVFQNLITEACNFIFYNSLYGFASEEDFDITYRFDDSSFEHIVEIDIDAEHDFIKTPAFKKAFIEDLSLDLAMIINADKELRQEIATIIADRLVFIINEERISLNTTNTNEEKEGEEDMMNKEMMDMGVEFDLSMEAETTTELNADVALLEDEDVAFDLNVDEETSIEENIIVSCDEVIEDNNNGADENENTNEEEEGEDIMMNEEMMDMGFGLEVATEEVEFDLNMDADTEADLTAEDTTAEDTTVEDTTVEDTTVEDTTVEDTTVEDTTCDEVETDGALETNTNDEVKVMENKEVRVSDLLAMVNKVKELVLAEQDIVYIEKAVFSKDVEANKDAIDAELSKQAKEYAARMKEAEINAKRIKNDVAVRRHIAKDAAKKALTNIETKALKTTLVQMGAKFPTELAAESRADKVIVTNALTVLTAKFGAKHNGQDIINASMENINKALASEEFKTLYVELVKKEAIKNSILTATVDQAVKLATAIAEETAKSNNIFHTANITTIFNKFRAPKLSVGKVIENRRKSILAKTERVTLNVLKADVDRKTNELRTHVSAVVMEENEAIRKGLIRTVNPLSIRYGNVGLYTENFTTDIILMDLNGANEFCEKFITFNVVWKGQDTLFLFEEYDLEGNVSYIDVTNNKEVFLTEDDIKAMRKFEIIGGSPSSLRKTQVLAFDVTDGMPRIDRMLNELTEGAYEKEYNKEIDAEQLSKYVTRFFTWTAPNKVIGTLKHAAVYFGKLANNKLDGAGYIFSKFYAKCMTEMTGIKVKPEDVEGFGVQCRPYSAKVFAPVVSESLFPVLCAESKGIVYIPEVTKEIDKKLDDAFRGKGEYVGKVVVFGEEGCDPEFFSDLNGYKTVFNWGKETNMRVLDIAKSGKAHTSIQMWEVPMNNDTKGSSALMQKLSTEQFGRVINDEFVDPQSQVPSYVSLAKSYYAKDVVKAVAPRYALDKDKSMFRSIVEDYAAQFIKSANRFKWEIEGEYGRLTSDPALLVSEYSVLQYGEVFSPAANDFFSNGELISKYMNESSKVKAMIGMRRVAMFKYPKMGVKEFYAATAITLENIIERINNLELKEDSLKYGTERQIKDALIEFYSNLKQGTVVVPGTDLLKQQCAGLDFDFDGASFVFDPRFIALLPEAKFVTNIDLDTKAVTKKLSKEDVKDSTLATQIFNNEDKINASSKDEARIRLTAAQLKKAFLRFVSANSDGWNVGKITNCNSTQIAILQAAKAYLGTGSKKEEKFFNFMKHMLYTWFKKGEQIECTGGSEKYIPLPTETASLCEEMDARYTCFANGAEVFNKAGEVVGQYKVEEDVTNSTFATVKTVNIPLIDACVENIKKADWDDKENLIAIFEDLNDIFRFYQEVIIDSAKTGKMIKIKIAPGKFFHALELNNDSVEFVWNTLRPEEKVFSIDVNTFSTKETIDDILFNIRHARIEKELTSSIDVLLSVKDTSLKESDVAHLAKAFNTTAFAKLNSQMIIYKKQYGDITSDWMAKREIAEADENIELLVQINKAYKKDLDVLGAAVRHAIKSFPKAANFDDVNMGAYVAFISSYNIKDSGIGTFNTEKVSQFGAKVLRAEYASYVIKYYAEEIEGYGRLDFCGEKVVYNNGFVDGDVVTLTNGVAETINAKGETKSLIVNANISGEFTVRLFKDSLYVTAPIVETLQLTKEFIERTEGEIVSLRANKEKDEVVALVDEDGCQVVKDGIVQTTTVNGKSFKDIHRSFKQGTEVEIHAIATKGNVDFGVYEVNEDGSLGRRLFNVDDCGSDTYRNFINGKRGVVTRKGNGTTLKGYDFFNCFVALK